MATPEKIVSAGRPASWQLRSCGDRRQPRRPRTGFFLLSFFVDVEATLGRLAALGLGGPPRRVDQPGPGGPITLATVRDPDGLTVLLTPGSITRSA
jgi:hypothetical protein